MCGVLTGFQQEHGITCFICASQWHSRLAGRVLYLSPYLMERGMMVIYHCITILHSPRQFQKMHVFTYSNCTKLACGRLWKEVSIGYC